MIGVNDIMRGRDLDVIFANYLKIIQTFKDKNIKVYIQSTLYDYILQSRLSRRRP
jgi:lysophospholipase L1-like esterase